jgi:hypothetical protein
MNWKLSSPKLGCFLASLALFALGCGSGVSYSYNDSVEGVVTLDNEPLANVIVSFVPESRAEVQPPISTAKTDEQGRFKLQSKRNGTTERPGAVLGKHAVLVTEQVAGSRKRTDDSEEMEAGLPTRKVPSHYGFPGQTPLTIDVTADKHDYPLTLTSH